MQAANNAGPKKEKKTRPEERKTYARFHFPKNS